MDDKLWKLNKRVSNRKDLIKKLYDFHMVSDELARLLSNNEKLGLYDIYFYVGRGTLELEREIEKEVLNAFAKTGDPLSVKIIKYLKSQDFPLRRYILMYTDIPNKLARREINEEEYFGYLNGSLPISSYNGVDYYLPKKIEVVE